MSRMTFIGLAALVVIGLLMATLASFLFKKPTFWPIMAVLIPIIAPLPNLVLGHLRGSSPFEGGPANVVQEIAKFVTGFLACTALIIPFFLWHVKKIEQVMQLLLTITGTIVISASILVFQYIFNPEDPTGF